MLKRLRYAALAAAIAAIGSVPAGTAFAQRTPAPAPAPAVVAPRAGNPAGAMVDEWLAGINANPGFLAEYESLTGTEGRIEIHGLTILNNDTGNGVLFDTVILRGYRDVGPTGFGFDELLIDRIQGRFADAEVQAINVAVRGVVFPETGYAFDPEAPFTSIVDILSMMAAVSMEEGSVARLDIAQDSGGLNTLTTYHNYVISDWSDGRIASISAGPMIVESPSPDGLLTLTVGHVESLNTDLDAMVHVFDVTRYEGGVGDPEWRTALQGGVYENIVVDAPGIRMRIRSIETDDFRLRQSDNPIWDMIDALAAADMSAMEADEMAGNMIVDMIMPFGVGRFSINDLDVYAEGLDRFHLGDFHLDDLSIDGLAEIGFNDLDVVVGGEGWVRIEHFAIGGLEMPDRELIRTAILTGVGDDLNGVAALIPKVAFLEFSGIEVGAPQQLPVTLGRFQLQWGGYVGPVPTTYRLEIQDFGAPLTLLPEDIRRILNQLGYTDANADMAFDLAWNEPTETLIVKDLYLSLQGAGSFRANISIAGVTRAMLTDPEGMDPTRLALAGAEFVLTDESIADRLFVWTAEGTNQPAEQYREEFIRGLPFLMSVLMDREVAARISPAIQQFLRVPGTMTVTMAPPEPVLLNDIDENTLNDLGALINLLGVTITTRAD